MPKARPDKVEFEKRLMAVQGWMIESVPTGLIVQQILAKAWAKSDRHAMMLVQKARQRWIKYEDDNRDDKRKEAVQKLKRRISAIPQHIKESVQGMRVILQYEREIIKLEGLYYDPKAPVATINYNVELTAKEMQEISKQLEDQY